LWNRAARGVSSAASGTSGARTPIEGVSLSPKERDVGGVTLPSRAVHNSPPRRQWATSERRRFRQDMRSDPMPENIVPIHHSRMQVNGELGPARPSRLASGNRALGHLRPRHPSSGGFQRDTALRAAEGVACSVAHVAQRGYDTLRKLNRSRGRPAKPSKNMCGLDRVAVLPIGCGGYLRGAYAGRLPNLDLGTA